MSRLRLPEYFKGALDIGAQTLMSEGGNDIFLATFDAQSAPQEAWRLGGQGEQVAADLA